MSIRDLPETRTIPWGIVEPAAGADLPAITLLTPCLNRADLIEAMLRSVAAQHYPGLRHIVVDGGSTDGTLDVLARHASVTVARQVSRGSHEAMNEGLPLVETPVVGFLNTDDLLLPGVLRRAGEAFGADPGLQALRFRAALFERADDDRIEATAEIVEPAAEHRLDELLHGTPGFNAWFFRTETVRALGGFDTAFDVAGDRELLLRLLRSGAKIQTLPLLGYAYRRHAGSRTLDHGARLRLAILADHVAIARKHLPGAGPALRGPLADWHAFETARLGLQHVKAGAIGAAIGLAAAAFAADPTWPARVGAGRRRAAALADSITSAIPSGAA